MEDGVDEALEVKGSTLKGATTELKPVVNPDVKPEVTSTRGNVEVSVDDADANKDSISSGENGG